MSEKFDPYEVLGVDRAASTEEIKAAGKSGAKKLHPDAGGNAEAFAENRRALAILISPTKRARFDRTGSVDGETVEHKTQKAMQVIFAALASLTNEYLSSDFKPEKDPRVLDVPAAVADYLRDQIGAGQKSLVAGRRHEAFLRDFAKRFKQRKKVKRGPTFDFIARQLDDEIKAVMEKIEMVESDIEVAKLAVEVILSYDFAFEVPDPHGYGTMAAAAAGLHPGFFSPGIR